ncbi:MAG: class I SAM-dependent methyltransferase [Chthoniobacteraceae bacterium]
MTDAVIDRGWVHDRNGNQREIVGSVTKKEAAILAGIIYKNGCKRCVETGVANGISTLAIAQAVAGNGGRHYGIDPEQSTSHDYAAINLLSEHRLNECFSLMEGPAHIMMPQLTAQGELFDFAFIDGMHTFHYKLIDYFFADKLLRIGGWMVFHDLLLPSVKKLYRYIQTQGKYRPWDTPQLEPPTAYKLRHIAAAVIKRKPLRTFWPNGFSNLLVLEKVSDEERPWNHFNNF